MWKRITADQIKRGDYIIAEHEDSTTDDGYTCGIVCGLVAQGPYGPAMVGVEMDDLGGERVNLRTGLFTTELFRWEEPDDAHLEAAYEDRFED